MNQFLEGNGCKKVQEELKERKVWVLASFYFLRKRSQVYKGERAPGGGISACVKNIWEGGFLRTLLVSRVDYSASRNWIRGGIGTGSGVRLLPKNYRF